MASKRAAVAGTRTASAASGWVVVDCGGHRFGVPVDRVREIVRGRATVRLPGCAPEVLGLVNLRGRILTVIDLGLALAVDGSADAAGHRFLVVERGALRVCFAVARVLGLAARGAARDVSADDAGRDELAVPAEALEALGAAGEHVVGLGEWDGAPFIALDPAAIADRYFS